ncbi:unnamed protein product [Mucor hiemalis]
MLTELPKELLKNVGNYLNNNDITNCQRHSLQNSFYLAQTEFSVGYQVRKLVIENGHIDPNILGELPLLCPYLEVFMYDGVVLCEKARKESFQYYQQRRNREEIDKVRKNFTHWKNMREIVEYNGITVAHSLLNNIQHLTHISVQFNNSNDRTNSKSSFISSLSNVPFLTSLSIERVYLSVIELEEIHANCPKLNSLRLVNTVFLPMEDDFSFQIKSANQIKRVKIFDGGFCNDVLKWLDYISQKYTNVKNLDIGNCSFTTPIISDGVEAIVNNKSYYIYQEKLLKIAKNCTKLESLTLLSFTLGRQFFDTMEKNGTYLSELTLGDGLGSVSLATELHNLIQSRQRHYIETLKIFGWPLSSSLQGIGIIMQTFGSCTNLTIIYLSMGRYLQSITNYANTPNNSNTAENGTIYFDYFLKCCPNVISLTIKDTTLTSTQNEHFQHMSFGAGITTHPLQALTLENVLLESHSVFQTLSLTCPSLVELSLIATAPFREHTNARHLNIHLPNHRLRSLTLDRVRVTRKCSIRLGASRYKISNAKKTTWYDLVEFERIERHFSFENNRVTSDAAMIFTEKMRARKVRVTDDAKCTFESTLDQSVYVAVYCSEIGSICLSGLKVV